MLNKMHAYVSGRYLLLIMCCVCCSLLTCRSGRENEILKLVYIEGIHDDAGIVTADSLFLSGKLKEAADLLSIHRDDASKQLYCQARLAEMDYYLRELYGRNHEDRALVSIDLPHPINVIDSFCQTVYYFYSEEKLDTHLFQKVWERLESKLTKEHYLYNKGYAMLGEYFYKMKFDVALLNSNLQHHKTWCKLQDQVIYDCYWTNIRLASAGIYARSHIESIAHCNELLTDSNWLQILDGVHQSLAHSTRAYVIFRFEKFERAFEDNEIAIKLSKGSAAIPIYQEALKSQLSVTNFWLKDSLWHIYLSELKQSIDSAAVDYVNYHRHVARFYHERGDFIKAIPSHQHAIQYCLSARHLQTPVLSSLTFLHSKELESTGLYKQAISAYLAGDIGYTKTDWKFEDLISLSYIKKEYHYVSFSRYGHIYFSWFRQEGHKDYLEKAEHLAKLAHSSYYDEIETVEESTLLTLAYERQEILELLCRIFAEKYFQDHHFEDLNSYYQYAEENRGSIFLKDLKTSWKQFPIPEILLLKEQILKLETKQILNNSSINQARLTKNNQAIRDLQNEIKIIFPDYFKSIFNQEIVDIELVQDSLTVRNKTILSIDLIENDIYFLWINGLNADLTKIRFTRERSEQIDSLILFMSIPGLIEADEYSRLAFKIWEWLIPEEVKLASTNKWIIIPDGNLNKLNFEALVTAEGYPLDYNLVHYLILEKEISYSPSIRIWMRPKNKPLLNGRIIGMAWSDEETMSELRKSGLNELPGSYFEMKSLQQAFPQAMIYSGKKATKANFLASYTNVDVSMLHLGIHGQANSERLDDLRLYFRKNDKGIDTLYGYDLLPLKSNVNTLIISACESGKGSIAQGEGNYNLARYFMANGMNEVFSALWKVNDRASEYLFRIFYSPHLDGQMNTRMRHAKMDMIISKSNIYSHPSYWGSIILIN